MAEDVSTLAARLASNDADARAKAAEQLAQLGSDAANAAPALVLAVADDDERIREWACAALEEIQPQACDSNAFNASLHHGNADVVYWSVTMLGRLGDDAADAVEKLVNLMRSSSRAHLRRRAAWALGKIGPSAATAATALQQASESEDPRLARLAKSALDAVTSQS